MSEPIKKPKRSMFRVGIIYTSGKNSGKSGCAFVKALTKEDAGKFIEDNIKSTLKLNGCPDESFKLEITKSSKDEVDFYLQNKDKKSYTGLVN